MTKAAALKMICQAKEVYIRAIVTEDENGYGVADRYFRVSRAQAIDTMRAVYTDEDVSIRCRELGTAQGWLPGTVLIG